MTTAAEYHAVKALSATGAWLIDSECPAVYWHTSPFNPNAEQPERGHQMDIGTAAHLALLEPARLDERTVVVEAKDWRTNKAREERDAAYEAGLTPLLLADLDLVCDLRDRLWKDARVAKLLAGAETEFSYFWTADNGIACKARADLVNRKAKVIADLKTSASANPAFFQRRAFDAGHFLRVPWYLDGWLETTGEKCDYVFITIASKPPHLITLARLDERAIEWGRMVIRRTLDIFKRCLDADRWPGYSDETLTVGLPNWAEFRMADREAEGDFRPSKAQIAAANQLLEP